MHLVKRFAVTIVGVALLALGVAMMVLPGPGILVIVAGLAVLATEYVWARRLLVRAQAEATKAQQAAVKSPARLAGTVTFGVLLLGLGLAMLIRRDLAVPFWSPVTGGILAVTALIMLTTTYLSFRAARGEDTTHTGQTFATAAGGSVRISPGR